MEEFLLKQANIMVKATAEHPTGWIESGHVHIKDGRITGLFSNLEDLPSQGDDLPVIDLGGQVVIPGLVNAHTHLSQTFMRGLASGRPLMRWLKELIWPLQKALSPELLELAVLLGLAENTRSGVSYVVNHHKVTGAPAFTDALIKASEQSGLRVSIARAWADIGANAEPVGLIIEELQTYFKMVADHPRLSFASGPLTPWRCSADTLQKTHQLALSYGGFSHMHVSETQDEVDVILEQTGQRPVKWLDNLGILDKNYQIVHAVWVNDDEIRLIAEKQAPVIHCPVSNAVLGSGIAPVVKMLNKEIDLHLGTDGPASNDTQDCFEAMKMALCFARAVNRDSTNIPPRQALRMATCSPGLTVGEQADLTIVKTESVWAMPVHDLNSALVLSSRASDVSGVIVDGEFVMQDGNLINLDEEIILREAGKAIDVLREKAGLDQ